MERASPVPIWKRISALHAFHYRDFRWLWLGTSANFMGISMQMITRGWLILRLTDDSPFALSMVMMAFALPMTFASLLGGAMADRFPRRHMIFLGQGGNAVLTLLLATLDVTGLIQYWHLLVLGVLNGTLAAFSMPSRQAITSDIVPAQDLMNAISLNGAAMNTTRTLGPALAGVLIIYLDTAGVFFLIAFIYLLAIFCTGMIRTGRVPAAVSGRGVASDILEGFRYMRANPPLMGLIVMGLVPALFGFPYIALLPAWAREAMNVTSDELGLLMLVMGVGSIAGALVLAVLKGMKGRGTVLLVDGMLWGLCLYIFSQCRIYPTALPSLFFLGFLNAVFMSLNMTLIQTYSSTEMRGRVVSMAMMTFGLMPLSAVPFGAIAERIGTAASLEIAGLLLCAFIVLFVFVNPKFRKVV